jgi:hypothetical protein
MRGWRIVALVLLFGLAGCSDDKPDTTATRVVAVEQAGDGTLSGTVEGRRWRLSAKPSGDEVCFDFTVEGMRKEDRAGTPCIGLADQERLFVVGVGRLLESKVSFAYGLVDTVATQVRVTTEDGQSFAAVPHDGVFAVVFSSAPEVRSVEAVRGDDLLASCRAFKSC